MHWTRRILASVGLGAVAAAAALSSSLGAVAADNVTGHVYVNDNTAGANTIGAFNRHADGRLTPLAGSPFTVGGAGLGTLVGSQGALQLSADGRYLLAVDAGSNGISVLRIGEGGGLQPVGSPTWSGGIEPISIAVHDDLVYVANLGNGTGGSDYTGFRLSDDGHLTPISGSTFVLPATAGPGDILFNSTGFKLEGLEVNTALIDSFVVGPSGRITPAPGSPFAAQGPGPFGSEFSPTNPTRLYVSNAHGGANAGSISAFSVAHNGALSSIGASPFADGQTAPCWVEISHNGRFLFTVNTGTPSISSFKIAADGSLGLIGSTAFKTGSATKPFDARLNPSGNRLYVVDAGLGAVSAFAVSGGTLSELTGSPFALPVGATPFGIVVI